MLKEIGSNFWISPEDISQENNHLSSPSMFGCDGSDFVWMSTGRSATRLVLQSIEERNPGISKIALIPSFTCHTVIEPFIDYGYKIIPLPINTNLQTRGEEIIDIQEATDAGVVLFHHYFGFQTVTNSEDMVQLLNKRGVVVIEDRTQCLYSGFDVSRADYYVGSIRKWCGVPDGGFAVCREGGFSKKPSKSDARMNAIKLEASIFKYDYIFLGKGEKGKFKALYREAEEMLNSQQEFYSLGTVSSIIQAGLDINTLIGKRRNNFTVLLNGLKDSSLIKPIFGEIPSDVTPLYFPVFADNRERVQSLLADNDVYAPVVWPKADCCPPVGNEAVYAYQHILCIPIDQRYDVDDMGQIVSILSYI